MPITDNRPSTGGGGGAVDSVNGQTGAVVITKSSIGLGNVDNTSDADKPVSTAQQTALDLKADQTEVDDLSAAVTGGTANALARYNASGELESADDYLFNADEGLDQTHAIAVTNDGAQTFNNRYMTFEPSENSPTQLWNINNDFYEIDTLDAGFSFGAGGQTLTHQTVTFKNFGTSDIGAVTGYQTSFDMGDGTDPFEMGGVSYHLGFGTIHDNVTLSGPMQGYGFQFTVEDGAIIDGPGGAYATGFFDNCTIEAVWASSWQSFQAGPQFDAIGNNGNYQGVNLNGTVDELQGNASVTGFNFSMNIGSVGIGTGSVNAVNLNPTVDNAGFYQGVFSSTQNVTVKPGAQSVLVMQDLTFTFINPGDNDGYTIEYVDDTTAGSESVDLLGQAITVHIESGVTDAQAIKDLFDATPGLNSAIATTITGTASNPQVTDGPDNFSGGENPGTAWAGYFDGDVNVTGDLSFGGTLAIGNLVASGTLNPIVDGGGTPTSVHFLVTNITGAGTVANADTLGINTAMLLTVDAGADLTTALTGIAALGLPAVVNMGAGANIDLLGASVFAISMDAGAAGGNVDQLFGGRWVAIPNGTTTVDRYYGVWAQLPFGAIATDEWGLYIEDMANNWIEGALKIGGTDVPDPGQALHVDGNVLIDGDLEVTGAILGVSEVTHIYTLLAGDITAEEITLPSTPGTPAQVRVMVIGGIEQENGVDFSVTGTTLSWSGLGYAALAEAGDKLIVSYLL